MKILTRLLISILFCGVAFAAPQHSFTVRGHDFLLDGKPFQIISGEMHYPRIPRESWRDRLKKARAMGLNAITTYVFWNLHEPRPGVYDFSGQLDVAEFIREAQQEGLYVILRPGPYVCSEWDLGGLPAWLLADPQMLLRSRDPKFLDPARRWLKRLGKELAPLQITRGGPILAVQVENEYGSFDSDHEYMGAVRDAIRDAGLGEALLYTADGPDELANGTLPDLPAVVNFGPGEAKEAFAALAKFRPNQPLMSGEYWAGWFDHWGRAHHATDAAQQEQELDWMLAQGYSVSLYMFHGGTTFGFMNGANLDRTYHPDTSSYDYDAALDESGRPTKKYFAFRDIIARHQPGVKIPEPPQTPAPISFAAVELKEAAALFGNLGRSIVAELPKPMEQFGQSYGYILYRTRIAAAARGELRLKELRDYAVVFVNGTRVGTLDRRLGEEAVTVDVAANATLDVLVENTGRVNFGKGLREERAGISGATLNGEELRGWTVYPLPMTDLKQLRFANGVASAPDPSARAAALTSRARFYRATLDIAQPGDTFLDTRQLGKGVAWVNGHLLGRFWKIGPQQTLYVPGVWLRRGKNEIVIFDLEEGAKRVQGLERPILDQLGAKQ